MRRQILLLTVVVLQLFPLYRCLAQESTEQARWAEEVLLLDTEIERDERTGEFVWLPARAVDRFLDLEGGELSQLGINAAEQVRFAEY